VTDTKNIPMLGDPMEMAGKGYRQFLMVRDSPHETKDEYSPVTGVLPVVVWIEDKPFEIANLDVGLVRCNWYRVARESLRHWKRPSQFYQAVLCICQGRLIE